MKKILSIILCMSLSLMYTLPVSAMEVMPKENVIEKEEVSATSGSVVSGAKVTSIKVQEVIHLLFIYKLQTEQYIVFL